MLSFVTENVHKKTTYQTSFVTTELDLSCRWRQRTVLNEFLRNTEVSRVDKPSEYFQFTENFHGNAPLEVFNLRRAPPSSIQKYKYEKVRPNVPEGDLNSSPHSESVFAIIKLRCVTLTFRSSPMIITKSNTPFLHFVFRLVSFPAPLLQVGRYVDGSLTLGNAMAEYHNGTVTVMERLTSSCTSNCASCHSPEADHVFIESPDQLYILATFNVHERGDKPLECGPLRGDRVSFTFWDFFLFFCGEEVL